MNVEYNPFPIAALLLCIAAVISLIMLFVWIATRPSLHERKLNQAMEGFGCRLDDCEIRWSEQGGTSEGSSGLRQIYRFRAVDVHGHVHEGWAHTGGFWLGALSRCVDVHWDDGTIDGKGVLYKASKTRHWGRRLETPAATPNENSAPPELARVATHSGALYSHHAHGSALKVSETAADKPSASRSSPRLGSDEAA
jgi:hypothetical protein